MNVGFKTVPHVAVDWRSRENSQKAVATLQVSDDGVWGRTAQVGIERLGQIPSHHIVGQYRGL